MEIKIELQSAEVIKTQNSLILDAKLLSGNIVPVFCASAEILSLCFPKTAVILSHKASKTNLIKYEVEFIYLSNNLVLANPSYRHEIFREAFENKILEDFKQYDFCRRIEKDEGLNYVDFELTSSTGDRCMVFIDCIYKKEGLSAVFPAQRNFFEFAMFDEMQKIRSRGFQTFVFMLVMRSDCQNAKFSWKLDPIAAANIFEAAKNGLNFVCYGCNIDKKSVTISKKMDILY